MKSLTGRQKEVLEFIEQYIGEHGYPPTIGEIRDRFSFAGPTAVTGHLEALRKKGCLTRTERISRGIALTRRPEYRTIPVLGNVPAGIPRTEEELPGETLLFDRSLVERDDTFVLRVKGESMRDAGIADGDYLIVAKDAAVRNGDIAVALLDDEYTVKYFFRTGDTVELRPAHPSFAPILVKKNLRTAGRVVGIFRKIP